MKPPTPPTSEWACASGATTVKARAKKNVRSGEELTKRFLAEQVIGLMDAEYFGNLAIRRRLADGFKF
jgi:hypothetical protein